MRSSRLVAILTVVLMFGFMLPMLCFALVSSGIVSIDATMPDGCHGEKNPMPAPSHSCCYVSHQVPQAVQITAIPVPHNHVTEIIEMPVTESQGNVPIEVEPLDTSPPEPAVLRI